MRRRPGFVVLVGVLAVLLTGIISALSGAAGIGVWAALSDVLARLPGGVGTHLSSLDAALLWQIRVPRVVLSAMVGGALGLCGCAYQGAFRNPLVDPYLLGSAAGAGLGATLAIVYLPGVRGWIVNPLPLFAFVGAVAAVALSFAVGHLGSGSGSTGARRDPTRLVLGGVAVASFFTALQTFAQQQGDDTLRLVYSWILGGLVTSGWSEVLLILPYLAVCATVILAHSRLLDVLSVGDDEARTLGVSPERIRTTVVIAASLGTAAAVAVSGLIGFVGLVVPHVVRLVFGSSHRISLPGSALFGAAFLVLADLAARSVLSPRELPIGVVTALVGAPFFAWLLIRQGRPRS